MVSFVGKCKQLRASFGVTDDVNLVHAVCGMSKAMGLPFKVEFHPLPEQVDALWEAMGLSEGEPSTAPAPPAEPPEPAPEAAAEAPANGKAKVRKLNAAAPKKPVAPAGTKSIMSFFTEKTLVDKRDIAAQRQAASEGRDFEVRKLECVTLPSEKESIQQPAGPVKVLGCSKCPMTFSHPIALLNHERSHSADAQPKVFCQPVQPKPPKPPVEVSCKIRISVGDGGVARSSVALFIAGRPVAEIAAERAEQEQAQAERQKTLKAERDRRQRLRDAEAQERRGGSARRGAYTAREKLKILDIFDEVRDDPAIKQKVDTFNADKRAKGAPYTTVIKWAKPVERARLSAAAAKEHAGSLLRVDKSSRRAGKFDKMEAELFTRLKARRARGLKVSARWLTAMGKALMGQFHPADAAGFKGGHHWRRRFAKRFKLGIRKKSNCKNKSWEQTEPILLRYFTGLRKRLQLGDESQYPELL
jgi:hypothetical protein